MSEKPRILVLLQYYLPGYKSGGPVRTIEGMVTHLGGQFDWSVISYDRDSGDDRPYEGVVPGEWRGEGEARVLGITTGWTKWFAMSRTLRAARFDALYLQSFFNPYFTILPLFLRRFGVIPRKPVLLAPRGELSVAALRVRPLRKKLFLWVGRWLGLLNDVHWQASSSLEAEEIINLGVADKERIHIARNLRVTNDELYDPASLPSRTDGLRIVFVSRVTQKKGLLLILEILKQIPETEKMVLNIYGPLDRGPEYWNKCKAVIETLPSHIAAEYHGAVENRAVMGILARHDVLFLPTKGENYGHVFIEALLAGCPILTSDQTPWRNLEERHAGWDLPLGDHDGYRKALLRLARMDDDERRKWRAGARKAGVEFLDLDGAIKANEAMIRTVLSAAPLEDRGEESGEPADSSVGGVQRGSL